MSALDGAVLVLNSGWAAVHIAPVRRAISLVYRGLAQIVSSEDFGAYDWGGWLEQSKGSDNGCIRAVSFKFMVPEVIRLNFFGGRQSRKVRFTRNNIFERDDHTCQYCGRRPNSGKLTLDHVVPRSRGACTGASCPPRAASDCPCGRCSRCRRPRGCATSSAPRGCAARRDRA